MLVISLLMLSAVHAGEKPQAHPLNGKIRDVTQQRFIDRVALTRQLQGVEYLLLGEKHDNPEHHRHQAWFLEQLARYHDRVSVAFEMIDQQQGEALRERRFDSADELIRLLDQHPNGWKYTTYYRDLFVTAIDNNFAIRAANMNRRHLREVIRSDERIDPAYQRLLDTTPWSNAQNTALKHNIEESHCNMLDTQTVDMMVRAQRLRDAVMARAMLSSEQPVRVLIAGNGHVRNDRGVPVYLDPGSAILSVGFIEVDPERQRSEEYSLPFDIAWFTSPVEREAPCEAFQRQQPADN
ncbi:MAG: ChaN family lipoprotein [Pseudomonadota bacterium]|nr:ChaN family lipoprotein [Pseudomonadota bacterium]